MFELYKTCTKFKLTDWLENLTSKAVRIKFTMDSTFLNMFYGKKRNPRNAGNQQKAF